MAANWNIGDRIQNRWQVHRILKGGMGVVYIVYDHDSREALAAKTFQDEVFDRNPLAAERFKREALAWVNLDIHENIAQARFVETINGKPYLFLEYVSGGDLSEWIGTPRLTEDLGRVLAFAIHFCDGMTHAVAKGIKAHRDIKPQNCLVTEDFTLKVTDFGLAKVALEGGASLAASLTAKSGGFWKRLVGDKPEQRPVEGLSQTGASAGTPAYMSPEQFVDFKHVDVRADVYSFGVMLFQMITGRLPFVARTWRDFALIHASQEPARGRIEHRKLEDIVMRCLAKDARNRFGDFASLRGELHQLFAGHTGKPIPHPVVGIQLTREQLGNKGNSLANLGYPAPAIECFDEVLRATPNDPKAWINKGASLAELSNLQDAIACFDRGLSIDRSLWQGWCGKGRVLIRTVNLEEAIQCFNRALELNPHNYRVWNLKGMVLNIQDKTLEALACFDRAIALNPRSAEAYLNKGVALAFAGHTERCAFFFYKARHLEEKNVAEVNVRGESVLEQSALRPFEEATGTNPIAEFEQAISQHELSVFQSKVKEILTAEENAVDDPEDDHKWIRAAILLEDIRLRDEAIECYDKAIQFHPRNTMFLVNKAGVLQDLKRGDEALKILDQALAIDRKDGNVWRNKGSVLIDLRRFKDAIVAFEEAKKLGVADASRGISFCLQKLGGDGPEQLSAKALEELGHGRAEEALALLDQALQLAPEYAQAWINKGVCLVHLNRAQQALDCFNQSLALMPDSAEAWINKGAALGELGKHREALDCFMQAKRLGLPQADHAIAICRKNLGLKSTT